MFTPKTEKIKELSQKYPHRIKDLESIFDKATNVYIDFANVFRWQEKLGWHISLKRLKQLFDSFVSINQIKFYSGTLTGDVKSHLNGKLKELNQQGIIFIEDLKCNFDVEIGRDMLLDFHREKVQNFILWSGDSDFADPLKQLLVDGKKVGIFATVRRVAAELNDLKKNGLFIFEIQKIKDFICWPRENQPV